MNIKKNKIKDALFGLCIGDALGVPVEFMPRYKLKESPVVDMIGFKVHDQPPGTWSDDSSLTFCLAESLIHGFDLHDIANKMCEWLYEKKWTPYGVVFDIGNATQQGIAMFKRGIDPCESGSDSEDSNGNGSLMRILPLAFFLENEDDEVLRYQRIHEVSSITHGHLRSQMACGIYIHYAINLIKGMNREQAYLKMQKESGAFYAGNIYKAEIQYFQRILQGDISRIQEKDIKSDGYVVSTLEAALWCLLTSNSYKETVLKAVNLGKDTDTTAAVTGGLAGIFYGYENIPSEWIDLIIRKAEIAELAEKFALSFSSVPL